ncbi:unnamed protein product [Oncorhynchus mykiss]|uniref:Uncharacterized protein n=1 Tax=Oncorhynchus mykiss TaxID=8022 RepID=A0A060W634_ONCMY|nr:unnamed protein product [Oncorhynchus mykiss]
MSPSSYSASHQPPLLEFNLCCLSSVVQVGTSGYLTVAVLSLSLSHSLSQSLLLCTHHLNLLCFSLFVKIFVPLSVLWVMILSIQDYTAVFEPGWRVQGETAGPGTLTMPAAAIQDYQRAETDRLNDLKGHLEIALLEKHFLQEELRKLREETNIDTLKQDLEKERSKRLDLEHKLNLDVLKMGPEDSPSRRPRETPPTANGTGKPETGIPQ